MSRIIGLKLNPHQNAAASAQRMLDLSAADSHWQMALQTPQTHLAAAWTGWHARPNLYEDQNLLIVMDGAIFNRHELGNASSDAALIADLYRRFGFEELLRRVNGDFSVGLFDLQDNTLWVGRDRLGVRPLYYTHHADLFAFASRPRPLLSLPGVSRQVNRQFVALFAASHYRTFDNNPHASPYADIAQLPAAHYLCLKDDQLRVSAYWHLEEQPDHVGSRAELAERYRDLMLDAVEQRFRVAVRPGFTLSGGMDSSSVLASAVQRSGVKQQAFSTVYDDKTYDESDEIRSMLDKTVEKWHTIPIGIPDVFDLVRKMVAVHDEPVATATWLSHFLLCEQASQRGFGSLFGGLGGDELNAGEYEYFFFHFADLRAAGQEQQLDYEVQEWARYHDHPIFKKNRDVMEQGLARLTDPHTSGRCLSDRARIMRYAAALNPDYFDLNAFEPVMDRPFTSYLKNRTYQDLFRETIPCCLRAEDRQSTAFQMDNFLPFFDYRLVEFMFRIPGQYKIRDGVTKRLLREAMKGILPEETRTRIKKTGWNAPAHVWFSGKRLNPIRDMVRSRAFIERGIYNPQAVQQIIEEHDLIMSEQRMVDNHMMFLWQMVNLELWLQNLEQ